MIVIPAKGRERAVQRVADYLLAALPGKELVVTVAERKRRRSDEQNRYWWGVVIRTYCDHLDGWDPEDVHEYLCGEHFGWRRIEGFGMARVKPVRRSSRLSRGEFADLVAFAQRKAAEHGFYVPDPNEYQ